MTRTIFLLLFFVAFMKPLSASEMSFSEEFQGEMTLTRFFSDAPGQNIKVSVYVHPDFLMFQNPDGAVMSLMGNHRAHTVIVRNQRNDIVFLTSDNKALVMRKQEVQQMIQMMENIAQAHGQSLKSGPSYQFTQKEEEKHINGWHARKWGATSRETSGEWHLWVTRDLNMPWGMLSEDWLTRYSFISELPISQWLNENKIPLQGELMSDGKMVEGFSIESISEEAIHPSRFTIPETYQQVTFQQLLFGQMRNNR
ncbi:hypothetical protein QLX67_02680 [Balneolaceae bacterium ANBcel3]|nr:hypothetical protein [Balneolaceae bacterium ANBcel3]